MGFAMALYKGVCGVLVPVAVHDDNQWWADLERFRIVVRNELGEYSGKTTASRWTPCCGVLAFKGFPGNVPGMEELTAVTLDVFRHQPIVLGGPCLCVATRVNLSPMLPCST